MSRKSKLKELKRIRAIRDELLIEKNKGRGRRLLSMFSIVESCTTITQFMNNSVEIRLTHGHEYKEYGETAFAELAKIVYGKYLEMYCT